MVECVSKGALAVLFKGICGLKWALLNTSVWYNNLEFEINFGIYFFIK